MAMLDTPFLCYTEGSWFKKRIVINMQQNTACGREGKGAAAFICQSAFEILLCAIMLKRFPHIESFHNVSGNDTCTVQWAIAAAAGRTAEWR